MENPFDGANAHANMRGMNWVNRAVVLVGWVLVATMGGRLARAEDAPITIHVDASDATRRIIHARLTIPVQPGALTLFYPKWIPGEHAPNGPINSVVNLHLSIGGKPVAWQRDPIDLYAIHCDIPADAGNLDIAFDYLVLAEEGGYSSGTSSSAQLTLINWNQVLLYPSGHRADGLTFHASLKLPPGWKAGTALPVAGTTGDTTDYKPVTLETLVDSPVVAGAFYRNIPLTKDGTAPLNVIDIVADSAAALALPDEEIVHYKQLVDEAANLYGATHYEHYHFLVALSEFIFHSGIEHHESSLNTLPERTFIDKDARQYESDLLPHEFTHSWNGKYRRPASLTTPDFQVPMQDDLLWVYEGLTEYAGSYVLTARSGLATPEWSHEWLASTAAMLDHRTGRNWRNLQDTATLASTLYDSSREWSNLRRGVDFYPEGVLVWLEVDTIIRQKTNGERSIDDFCHAFHGGQSGPPKVVTYTFDDVVNTLNSVVAYDWRGLLSERLDSLSPRAPLGGIENAGWHVVYNDQPNKPDEARDTDKKTTNLSYSLGLIVKEDGVIQDVIGDGPAFAAGISPSMKLVAVNGRAWNPKLLKEALAAAKAPNSAPLELLVVNDEFYKTYRLDYHGGERYPHLERDAAKPDLLEAICRPHAAKPNP